MDYGTPIRDEDNNCISYTFVDNQDSMNRSDKEWADLTWALVKMVVSAFHGTVGDASVCCVREKNSNSPGSFIRFRVAKQERAAEVDAWIRETFSGIEKKYIAENMEQRMHWETRCKDGCVMVWFGSKEFAHQAVELITAEETNHLYEKSIGADLVNTAEKIVNPKKEGEE